MTFETIEKFRFYIGGKVRKDRISAVNCREGGYKELSLQHENEAVLGEQLLRELSQEHGGLDAKRQTNY